MGRGLDGMAAATTAVVFLSGCVRHIADPKLELLRKTCEGDPGAMSACVKLADAYKRGMGVQRDEDRAAELLDHACSRGDGHSCHLLAERERFGWRAPCPTDSARANQLDERACKLGSSVGCRWLGLAYQSGWGLPRDEARAAQLFERACPYDPEPALIQDLVRGPPEQSTALRAALINDSPSCELLGEANEVGRGVPQDRVRAGNYLVRSALAGVTSRATVDRLHRACALGNAFACFFEGVIYASGDPDVERNEAAAIELFERACHGGLGAACFLLGRAHASGNGTRKDDRVAAEYFKQACDRGVAAGCALLVTAHRLGQGASRDDRLATDYARRACERLHDPQGCMLLGYAYAHGLGVESDQARALALYQDSCRRENGDACACLGIALSEAKGGTPDQTTTVNLFRRACSLDRKLCGFLAQAHQRGFGVPKDDAKAAALFRDSCDAGASNYCVSLGDAYAEGRGVERDLDRAHALYRKACTAGSPEGCQRLEPR